MEIQTNGMAEFPACLTKLKEAPRKGWLLAYTRTQVLFSRYEETGGDREQLAQLLEGSQLLELHIFDEEKEYRYTVSSSKRARKRNQCLSQKYGENCKGNVPGGWIEHVAAFPEKPDHDGESVLKEQILLEANAYQKETITMLHHIVYESKSGMAYVDDYRLVMEKEA